MRPDRVEFDEVDDETPRRELIVQRPDGSTYSAEFPGDRDLGEILQAGEIVVADHTE